MLYGDKERLSFTFVVPAKPELLNRVEELGIKGEITFLGNLSADALEEEYAQARFLWVHSIDEGFCLPIVEALIKGIPVLVSDIPSLRELWMEHVDYINPFNRYEAAKMLYAYLKKNRKDVDNPRLPLYEISRCADGIWSALGLE